ETALYAYLKQDSTETVVGKLNLLSFDEQIKKVYLVGVNGAPLPSIYALQEELNRIYAPALTRWNVAQAKAINVTFPNGSMTHGGSNAFSVYNADQKKVIKAFGEMEKEAYYLFFVNNVTNKNGIAGYMPLQYQSGFIYDNTQVVNIAHELAHGVFNLAHTFASPFIASEGQSDNLLDYNQNTALWKHQWKLVHDPKNLWLKFLQDEEDGEYAENNYLVLEKDGIFFTPTADPLFLPKGTKIYSPVIDYRFLPKWPVYFFETPDGKYIADVNIQTANPLFYGYKRTQENQTIRYNESINRPATGSSVIVTLVDHRSEKGYDILSLYESEKPYKLPPLGLVTTIPIVGPEVGTVKKIDESNPLIPYGVVGTKQGESAATDSVYSKNKAVEIKIHYDRKTKKYTVDVRLEGNGNDKTRGQKEAIAQQIKTLAEDKLNELGGLDGKTTDPVEDDGFYVASMNGRQWLQTLSDLGNAVWNDAALPQEYWNQDKEYKSSTIHTPSLFAGISDGVIEEITAYPQLIQLGYNIATQKEVRQELWNSVKNISVESIKNAAVDFYEAKKANYTSEKSYIVNHTAGKDAVQVVTMLSGGTVFTKGAKDGLAKGVRETGEKFAGKSLKNADELAAYLAGSRDLIRNRIIDMPQTKTLAKEYAQHIGVKDADFEDWFTNTFKKYESGTPNFEAHHVIPVDVLKDNPYLKELLFNLQKNNPDFKFDFNGLDNGIMVPKKSISLDINGHAKHNDYSYAIDKKITEIINEAQGNDLIALQNIEKLVQDAKNTLKNEVLLGTKNVNDIVIFNIE
ncbi:MAG: AHH domain-containing protein, partial [Dysgonamonadaceae bacterium]|nr:AHH domain-containing protein [Dysgonamonadaceae bacterium]